MPAERRSLRSNNKSDTSSSANGEKASSNQSSGAKDKAAPTTRAAAKAKSAPAKKGAKATSNNGMEKDDKSQNNEPKSTGNGVNGSEEVEMGEDTTGAPTSSFNSNKDRNGNEMTVVVPPTKGSRSSGKTPPDNDEDVTMEGADGEGDKNDTEVDPVTKAIQGKHFHAIQILGQLFFADRKLPSIQ